MCSGGVDSTGALYLLVSDEKYKDFDIYVHHVNIIEENKRHIGEQKAIKEIINKLSEIRPVEYSESTFEIGNKGKIYSENYIWDMNIIAFVVGQLCTRDSCIKAVANGATKNDTINGKRTGEPVTIEDSSEYMSQKTVERIKFIYPVIDMTKEEVIKMLPVSIKELTWSCREPVVACGVFQCKKCRACKSAEVI